MRKYNSLLLNSTPRVSPTPAEQLRYDPLLNSAPSVLSTGAKQPRTGRALPTYDPETGKLYPSMAAAKRAGIRNSKAVVVEKTNRCPGFTPTVPQHADALAEIGANSGFLIDTRTTQRVGAESPRLF